MSDNDTTTEDDSARDFIRDIVRADLDAGRSQRVDLAEDRGRIVHDARADHARRVRAEDAAGYMMKLIDVLAVDHGVARIGAALIANDNVGVRSEQIDKFTLGFVAPLQTDNARSRHDNDLN